MHGFTCVKQPLWVEVKKSGGGRKPKFQTSKNQNPKDAPNGSKQTLRAVKSFYLETVLKP
jgi:hypothetical protein